jgi:hypothetical protein
VMQYTQASVDLTEIASEIPTNYKY